jgi:ribosome biogenesis GTPase A
MFESQVIQWFPGHMAAAMRKMEERLKLVDVVIEVVDARLPSISANPLLDELIGKRPRLTVLGREDLAEPAATVKWLMWYNARGRRAIAINGKDQASVGKLNFPIGQLVSGRKASRAIVIGTPNTGKSSIINGILRRQAAKTEDKAGVTRQLQWFRVQPNLELMDTPGILVPKIASKEAQWMLALTGALPRERFDPEEVVGNFTAWLAAQAPKPGRSRIPDLETFAKARGFMRKGGEIDLHNAAGAFIADFGDAKFGRLTFEEPPEA